MRQVSKSALSLLRALLPGLLFITARLLAGHLEAAYEDFRQAGGGPGVNWLQLLGELVLLGAVLVFWRREKGRAVADGEKAGRTLMWAGYALSSGLLFGLVGAAVAGLAGDAGMASVSLPQALILCLVSPVSEELVYRGMVLARCRQIIPLRAAVMLSALLFAAAHGSLTRMTLAFLSGVVWGAMVCRTKTVRCSCLSHAVANMVNLVILLLRT